MYHKYMNNRFTSSIYEESVTHVKTFGAIIGKTNYLVLTYHDVIAQLMQRELKGRSHVFYNFNMRKAETLFRKEVPVKPLCGMYKGKVVEVGHVCSKKKTRAWFRRNLNRMLGNS